MKIVRIVLLAVVAAAGVLVAGPAPAASAGALPIQYKVSSVSGPPNTVVRGTALCPTGSRMVSSGAGSGGSVRSITSITPLPDFSGATATGITGPTANQAFIRVLVGCLPLGQVPGVSSARYTFRTGNFFADASGNYQGVVPCPAGMRAFGGGGHFAKQGVPTAGSNGMNSNGPTAAGTGWTFRGHSGDRGATLVITTQCAALPGAHVAQAQVPLNPLSNPGGTVHAPCLPGYTMLSGGFKLTKLDGTEQAGSIRDSFPGAEGWIVSANAHGTPDTKLVTLAQCFLPTG